MLFLVISAAVIVTTFCRSPSETDAFCDAEQQFESWVDTLLCNEKQCKKEVKSTSCGSCRASVGSLVGPQLFLHLQPIFDWNVKQLFLYLSAEYATKSNVSHSLLTHTHTHTLRLDWYTGTSLTFHLEVEFWAGQVWLYTACSSDQHVILHQEVLLVKKWNRAHRAALALWVTFCWNDP